MTKMIELVCEKCGCPFTRKAAEVTRNKKRGRRVFCGRLCQGAVLGPENGPKGGELTTVDISQYSNNRKDEYTAVRYHLMVAKRRAKEKGLPFDLDLPYLKELWQSQSAICPLTGWKLEPYTLRKISNRDRQVQANHASLDRIVSSKGYVKGNVQFIAFQANMAKHKFTDQELIDFCRAVAKHNGD